MTCSRLLLLLFFLLLPCHHFGCFFFSFFFLIFFLILCVYLQKGGVDRARQRCGDLHVNFTRHGVLLRHQREYSPCYSIVYSIYLFIYLI